MRARTRRWLLAGCLASLAAGGLLLGEAGYLAAKARLADVLIARSWRAHLADGAVHPPWPWADLHPLAELRVPRLRVTRRVLSGAGGGSLAFGLGHVDGTAPPGDGGHVAVAGHRDGVARFLRDLRPGDRVELLTRAGLRRYRVAACDVVPSSAVDVLDPLLGDRLTLLTCYPFDAWRETGLRYAVACLPDSAAPRDSPCLLRRGSPTR